MDIRRETVLIIRRGRMFLYGRNTLGLLVWGNSKWDAWRTRIPAKAKSVQQKVGGEIMLFNPVSGQIRRAKI